MDDEQPGRSVRSPGGLRWGVWVAVLAAAGLYLYAVWYRTPRAGRPAGSAQIAWSSDLAGALQEAPGAQRPVLVVFHATWCEPCKWMEREVFSTSEAAAALGGWLPVHIDIDEQPGVAARYEVQAVPTLIALAPDGRELRRFEGAMATDDFVTFLRSARPQTASRAAPAR